MREAAKAMFNTDAVIAVDGEMLAQIKQRALASADQRFRLCLHESNDAPLQEMIIAAGRDAYCRPHYHAGRATSYLLVEGALTLVLFDAAGGVMRKIELHRGEDGGACCARLGPDVPHMTVVRSGMAVFYENLVGPYERDTANTFPVWAPREDDTGAIAAFLARIGESPGCERGGPLMALPLLRVPERYNYIAVFLTLRCNLRCSYCINHFGDKGRRQAFMPGADWIRGLNRITSRPDLAITLQGGEPSLHPDFCEIINGLRADLPIDILTNLQFDVDAFMARVPPERVRREAPYASIRVSYHPEVMALDPIKIKVLKLLDKGYSVGIWGVSHPTHAAELERAREVCGKAGIDFRLKEFLGVHEGQVHGTYKYPEGLAGRPVASVACRTSELILGPGGDVFRCHADLYAGRQPIGHIGDAEFQIEDSFRPCDYFGCCNPCDIKVKTDRFQQFGHTSVEIRR